jgi:hypothetical protein
MPAAFTDVALADLQRMTAGDEPKLAKNPRKPRQDEMEAVRPLPEPCTLVTRELSCTEEPLSRFILTPYESIDSHGAPSMLYATSMG